MTGDQGRRQEAEGEGRWTPREQVGTGDQGGGCPRATLKSRRASAPDRARHRAHPRVPNRPRGPGWRAMRCRELTSGTSQPRAKPGGGNATALAESLRGKLRLREGVGEGPSPGRRRGVESPAGWPPRRSWPLRSLPPASPPRGIGPVVSSQGGPCGLGLSPARPGAAPGPRAYLSAGARGPWAAGGLLHGAPGGLRRPVAAEQAENL